MGKLNTKSMIYDITRYLRKNCKIPLIVCFLSFSLMDKIIRELYDFKTYLNSTFLLKECLVVEERK